MRLLTESSSSGYQTGIERRMGDAGNEAPSAGLEFGTYTTASTCFSASLTRSLPDIRCGSRAVAERRTTTCSRYAATRSRPRATPTSGRARFQTAPDPGSAGLVAGDIRRTLLVGAQTCLTMCRIAWRAEASSLSRQDNSSAHAERGNEFAARCDSVRVRRRSHRPFKNSTRKPVLRFSRHGVILANRVSPISGSGNHLACAGLRAQFDINIS